MLYICDILKIFRKEKREEYEMNNIYTTEKLKEIELREMGYSEEYINIKRELEASWPKWKINAYNDYFAISPYAKKLRGEYK